eukprot:12913760-Prorocentrum_lima.AAC.1
MMRGGPKGQIHISCNPCRMECVVRCLTMPACVKRVQVAITHCQGSFFPSYCGTAADAADP